MAPFEVPTKFGTMSRGEGDEESSSSERGDSFQTGDASETTA